MKHIISLAFASLFMLACSNTHTTLITLIPDQADGAMDARGMFPTVTDKVWNSLSDSARSSINCVLLEVDGQSILFDAGMGTPSSMLLQTMKVRGITPDKLDYIYLTHVHPDHIGGLLKDDQATFPNAQLYVNRQETWNEEADENSLQHKVLQAYANRIEYFDAGETLPGGVQTMAAYGHTTGHTIFQKDDYLIVGDLIHCAALQLSHPQYSPFFDADPDKAVATRQLFLDYARDNHLSVYGMHMPDVWIPGETDTAQ